LKMATQGYAGRSETTKEKMIRYETLLNERMQDDLQRLFDERDIVYENISNCLELRNNMRMIQDQNLSSMKTMVNIGCDFYANANIPDTSWVYVNIGLGFQAQMTLDEAIIFSNHREAEHSKKAETLTNQIAELKARIKLVGAAINEMAAQQDSA